MANKKQDIRTTIRVPEELHRAIKMDALSQRLTMNDLIVKVLSQYAYRDDQDKKEDKKEKELSSAFISQLLKKDIDAIDDQDAYSDQNCLCSLDEIDE